MFQNNILIQCAKNKIQGMKKLFTLHILNLSPFKTTFYLRVYMTVAAYKVDFYTVEKQVSKGMFILGRLNV